jgi:hypothetical protein
VEWWDGSKFDGVIAGMSPVDSDDLDGVLRTVSTNRG